MATAQKFTEQQVSAFLAELKRQASARGNATRLDGISWRPLQEIAGPNPHEVFPLLRARGLIREEVLPGCFGHTVHYFAE